MQINMIKLLKLRGRELTLLVTFGSAPAFNKHLIVSVSPLEAATSKGVFPREQVFGSAPA